MATKSAQVTGNPSSLSLTSEWTIMMTSTSGAYQTPSTEASATVSFPFALPSGAKINSAKVHAEWGNPSTGYAVRSINDLAAPLDGEVDVPLTATSGTLTVTFRFKANGSLSGSYGAHSAVANVSNIYLLIEYESGGVIYKAVNGALVGYGLYRAENGKLVQYTPMKAVGGRLVEY